MEAMTWMLWAAGLAIVAWIVARAAVGRGPAASVRRRPWRHDLRPVVVAGSMAAVLIGFAALPVASAVTIAGVAILVNAIFGLTVLRRRERPDDDARAS